MKENWTRFARRLVTESTGTIAIQMAVALPALIGMAALGAEMTTLYVYQKRMQRAADQAVLSAGTTGLSGNQPLMAARAMAAANGYVDGYTDSVGKTIVTLNTPPTTGPNIATASAREVIISRPYALQLARIFLPSPITVKARAVSIPGRQSTGCILALAKTANGAISVSNNNTAVSNISCEIVSNSTSSSSLAMNNLSTISGPVYLAGGASLSGGAKVLGTPFVLNGTPLDDPYSTVTIPGIPSGTTCTTQTSSDGKVVAPQKALNPGWFCNGLTIESGNIVMNPGVYIIDKILTLAGTTSTLTGTSGTTLVLNSGTAFSIKNGFIMRITAPLTGATAGLAIVSNRNLAGNIRVEDGAQLVIEGAVYLPSMSISFSGGGKTSGANCTQLIAQTITISTSLNFKADCSNSVVKKIGRTQPVLAE